MSYPLHDLDALVEHSMQAWNVPGLALAIVKDDEVILAKGYGISEQGSDAPIDHNTIFAIASNTKAVTATALGLLVQEGRLRWDDRVIDHLSAFAMYDPYVTHHLTVRDLLCHRAGLGTWAGDLMGLSCYSRDEVLHRIRYIKPAYGFRAGYGYCNLLFAVAGAIIPAVTGTSWDDFIAERFFKPLGMTRSTTSTTELAGYHNIATPHVLTEQGTVTVPYRNVDGTAPAGAINASVSDAAQWLRLQLAKGVFNGERIVNAEIIEESHTPHTIIKLLPAVRKLFPSRHFMAYGLGWGLADYHGRLLVSHTGSLDGMTSVTMMIPEERLGIVVLTNMIPHHAHLAVAYSIIDRALGLEPVDWVSRYQAFEAESETPIRAKWMAIEGARVPNTAPSRPVDAFTGQYANRIYGEAIVTEEAGQLVIRLGAHPDVIGKLEHWHYDTYLCRWSDPSFDKSIIPFWSDGGGRMDGFKVTVREDWIDPLEYSFARIG